MMSVLDERDEELKETVEVYEEESSEKEEEDDGEGTESD